MSMCTEIEICAGISFLFFFLKQKSAKGLFYDVMMEVIKQLRKILCLLQLNLNKKF